MSSSVELGVNLTLAYCLIGKIHDACLKQDWCFAVLVPG